MLITYTRLSSLFSPFVVSTNLSYERTQRIYGSVTRVVDNTNHTMEYRQPRANAQLQLITTNQPPQITRAHPEVAIQTVFISNLFISKRDLPVCLQPQITLIFMQLARRGEH